MPTDFKSKGLSWVGSIYQKLETFYQEMDNIVTEDTVRYVEGQVHNVGENMKKFYSDVVQDLIPRSCETETQAMAQESSAANGSEHHGITEDLIPLSCETQAMAQESSAASGSEQHGFTKELNQSLAKALVTNTVNNNQCDAALQTYSPDGEELQNSNRANDLNHAVTVSDSSADEANCPTEVINSDEVDCPSEVINSDEVDCPSEVIDGDETAPSRDSFPIDNVCSSKVSFSDTDYSADHDGHDVGGSIVSIHFKSMSGTHFENENVDVTNSSSDSLLLSELADTGMETIDLSDKVKDEDNCVIVDNSLLHEVPPRHWGNKSYKKILQDVFSSKRRLVKEYNLLAIAHGDLDVVSRRGSVQNQLTSRIIKASDTEWEIL